jgi:hypothetical protein
MKIPTIGTRMTRAFLTGHLHGTVVDRDGDLAVLRDEPAPDTDGYEGLAGWYPAEEGCCASVGATLPPPTAGLDASTTVAQLLLAGIDEPLVLATVTRGDPLDPTPGVIFLRGQRVEAYDLEGTRLVARDARETHEAIVGHPVLGAQLADAIPKLVSGLVDGLPKLVDELWRSLPRHVLRAPAGSVVVFQAPRGCPPDIAARHARTLQELLTKLAGGRVGVVMLANEADVRLVEPGVVVHPLLLAAARAEVDSRCSGLSTAEQVERRTGADRAWTAFLRTGHEDVCDLTSVPDVADLGDAEALTDEDIDRLLKLAAFGNPVRVQPNRLLALASLARIATNEEALVQAYCMQRRLRVVPLVDLLKLHTAEVKLEKWRAHVIDLWHAGKLGDQLALHDVLGMTEEEYAAWVELRPAQPRGEAPEGCREPFTRAELERLQGFPVPMPPRTLHDITQLAQRCGLDPVPLAKMLPADRTPPAWRVYHPNDRNHLAMLCAFEGLDGAEVIGTVATGDPEVEKNLVSLGYVHVGWTPFNGKCRSLTDEEALAAPDPVPVVGRALNSDQPSPPFWSTSTWTVYRHPDVEGDDHRALCAFEGVDGKEVVGHVATGDHETRERLEREGYALVGWSMASGKVRLLEEGEAVPPFEPITFHRGGDYVPPLGPIQIHSCCGHPSGRVLSASGGRVTPDVHGDDRGPLVTVQMQVPAEIARAITRDRPVGMSIAPRPLPPTREATPTEEDP